MKNVSVVKIYNFFIIKKEENFVFF
uniref:Uncharacterized protein n=1 Tax=Megaselia scalaris TaxID=36166 RepID=T1GRL7_MEGSC